MRPCPSCAAANPDDAIACVGCGRRLTTVAPVVPVAAVAPAGKRPPPRRSAATAPLGFRQVSTPPPLPPRGSGSVSGTGSASGSGSARDAPSEPRLPPPTRPALATLGDDAAPEVDPMPEAPEAGVVAAVRYAITYTRGRWQRGRAIRFQEARVREDTGLLDGELGQLGAAVHRLGVDDPSTAGELRAIEDAERRRDALGGETVDLERRLADENQRGTALEVEREGKRAEAERALAAAEEALEEVEARRRGLREKRKSIERQLKGYLKAAEEREAEAGKLGMGDPRMAIRRAAEEHRRQAAALDPERQAIEGKLDALDKPLAQATARVESLRAELEAARRALEDVREGHRHRLAELDAEQGRKGKELSAAAGEIARRLVTLGTIVNLNRVERPELDALYGRIDVLRERINERGRRIDRLTAEREGVDRGALLRGAATLAVALVAALTILIVVLAAL